MNDAARRVRYRKIFENIISKKKFSHPANIYG